MDAHEELNTEFELAKQNGSGSRAGSGSMGQKEAAEQVV